jgi:hypothetical protein
MVADELASFTKHMVHCVVWRDQTPICVRELLGCGYHSTKLSFKAKSKKNSETSPTRCISRAGGSLSLRLEALRQRCQHMLCVVDWIFSRIDRLLTLPQEALDYYHQDASR